MEVTGELIKKEIKKDNGEIIKYYAIQIPLYNGEVIEVTVKGDKAKLLMLSLELESK